GSATVGCDPQPLHSADPQRSRGHHGEWIDRDSGQSGHGALLAAPSWRTSSSADVRRPDPRLLEVSEFEWPSRDARAPAEKWMVHVHIGLSDWVPVRRKMLSQDYSGIALARLLVDGRAYEIAFDYSDYPIINEECARRVAVYFKMQHPVGGFPGSSNVYPGGF